MANHIWWSQFFSSCRIEIVFLFWVGSKNLLCCSFLLLQKWKSPVLSVIWMKEYLNIPVSSFPMYRNIHDSQKIDDEPLLCVVTTGSIHSCSLILPFKEQSCYVLQIIHPSYWAYEFLVINKCFSFSISLLIVAFLHIFASFLHTTFSGK